MDERQPGLFLRFLLGLPIPWIFLLGYLAGMALQSLIIPGGLAPSTIHIETIGIGLFVAGALLAGWGWMLFHFKGTTKIPGEVSTALVTSGPYRVTRNPMYVGLTLAYLGEVANKRQIIALAVLPAAIAYVNLAVIPLEEKRLRDAFGPAYDAYRRRVRRWL